MRLTLLVLGAMAMVAACRAEDPDAALEVFNRRILPILQARSPSSCSECHLSGVDLKQYIHASQEKTFAALRSGGLIDLKDPRQSEILRLIARQPEKPSIVSQQAREQELAAFTAWILAAVKEPQLLATRDAAAPAGPELPREVVRHARQDRVLSSFVEYVWSEVGRCAACHSPDRNQQQAKKHGPQVSWIKLGDPAGTLAHLVESGLIDTDAPEASLVLAKPTLQVEHGGGQKMVVGDRSYKQFRRFLDDYAAVVKGTYRTVDKLPPPAGEVSQVSEIWFKLQGVPEKFDKQLLQVDLYRWDTATAAWAKERMATGDRPVFGGGKLWQQHLTLVAKRGSSSEHVQRKQLPPGRYIAKIYIDQAGKAQRDFEHLLGEAEYVGQVELESRWPEGYGKMTVATYPL